MLIMSISFFIYFNLVFISSVHEAAGGHGYNEAVEDYNRAQHNSSSSPSRGYTDHLNAAAASPGPNAVQPPNTTSATYSTAQHISTMMGTPASPGIFQSSSSKFFKIDLPYFFLEKIQCEKCIV